MAPPPVDRFGDVQCEAKEQIPMPAKDRYHDVVVRALQKDGWTILKEQAELIVPPRRLWIDLRAAREAHTLIILVEVKGFEAVGSPVAYLSDAIGQCVVYNGSLDYLGIADALYLAVPTEAMTGILGEEVGRRAVQQAQIGVIVVDPIQEVIVRWIHSSTP
jgi:hypothetical protein